jgi:pyruvate/2-oxoglutarate dehydrogenase complex dihydrolipoamide acyltransferase (E2) component
VPRREHFSPLTPPQVQDGAKNVPVGKVIALLGEEGDDLSNLQAPAEDAAPPKQEPPAPKQASPAPSPPKQESSPPKQESAAPKPEHAHAAPTHSRPLFPSVLRLLTAAGVSDAAQITGTGVRGMLTKGDVLAFLGHASSPTGSYKPPAKEAAVPAAPKKDAPKVGWLAGSSCVWAGG